MDAAIITLIIILASFLPLPVVAIKHKLFTEFNFKKLRYAINRGVIIQWGILAGFGALAIAGMFLGEIEFFASFSTWCTAAFAVLLAAFFYYGLFVYLPILLLFNLLVWVFYKIKVSKKNN